ncbi:MAG: hypothetical protein HY914_19120 [Desulfomonile tiedjei]|nr:hypothetical protein [Desulfomonile tiedjei]
MAHDPKNPFIESVHADKAVIAQVANFYQSTNWVPKESEIAAEIVTELENRRVLYNDYELEIPAHVVQSVLDMRDFFHNKLLVTRKEGALASHLRVMRAACRKFLNTAGDGPGRVIIDTSFDRGPSSWTFFTALGELRSAIGVSLSLLLAAYDLTVEPELARILPADPVGDRL